MPKAKKRALSSSSESSGSECEEEEKTAEKVKKKIHLEKKLKTATTSSSDEQGKAKKSKREKQEKQQPPPELQITKDSEKKINAEPEKILKTTTVKDMLRAKRDKQRKMEQGKPTNSGTTTATDDDEIELESTSSVAVSESSRDSHPEIPTSNGIKDILLPESLPADIVIHVASLKQRAEVSINTKTSFFDNDVLNQLVEIDNAAKNINAKVRVQTFKYLETFTTCNRKTLFAKVRKHRVDQADGNLKREVHKLHQIVTEMMPGLVSKYDADVAQQEELRKIQVVIGDTPRDHVTPRKKFHWNDNSRKILSEIYRFIRELFKAIKEKKEGEEAFIVQKLKELVIPLWPEGWVRIEEMQKELERKKKKEARAVANAAATSQGMAQSQGKSSSMTAGVSSSNGKASMQSQKTESVNASAKSEPDNQNVNGGKLASQKSSTQTSSVTSPSVIKRSSDHSINSIISSSPSPPTTSQQLKSQNLSKTRVVDADKLTNPNEVLKTTQQKSSIPRFNQSPIDNLSSDKALGEKVRRSDSSDSDCVEIVGEFNPIQPAKSVYPHNNISKLNHQPVSILHPAPIAKKMKKPETEDGDHGTDYSKIIMGIQSLTV